MDKKRLWIYLAFTFGLTWSIFFTFILTGHKWMEGDEISPLYQLISLGMLCPTLAMLLTRYVTKEGFAPVGEDSMLLGISFKNKKWIWYIIALLLPWIYFELGNGLILLLSPDAFELANPANLGIEEKDRAIIFMQPIAMMIAGAIGSFAAFGEEAGWRGYMMPKMIKLWGVKKALLFGGIIWGIWHWPLTYIGHNFGTEYFGYPFTGFAAMCVMCVFIGVALTYITYKSGSIWPAAILHAVNNSTPSILQYYINQEKITGWKADEVALFLVFLLPMMVISGVLFFYLGRSKEVRPKGVRI